MSVIKGTSDNLTEHTSTTSVSKPGQRLVGRRDLPHPPVTTETFDDPSFREFSVDFDPGTKTLFYYQEPIGHPGATQGMMREIRQFHATVREVFRRRESAEEQPVRHMVFGSRAKGRLYNVGGDLRLFVKLIHAGDRKGLRDYGRLCIDCVYGMAVDLNLPIASYALVEGDALGGGFEAALSNDVIIAERSAKFGFPEILFSLFPGMGAYSLLARRIAPAAAERIILSGSIYTAEELHELGVVDIVAPDGEGHAALYEHLRRNERRYAAHSGIYQVRRMVNPLRYEELANVVDLWVETAMKVSDSDLKRMTRLANAQDRRLARDGETEEAASDTADAEVASRSLSAG